MQFGLALVWHQARHRGGFLDGWVALAGVYRPVLIGILDAVRNPLNKASTHSERLASRSKLKFIFDRMNRMNRIM